MCVGYVIRSRRRKRLKSKQIARVKHPATRLSQDDIGVDQPTDADLVARANASDANAFEALYLRYRDWVTNLASRFTRGDRELALDVMQDTFMHLYR